MNESFYYLFSMNTIVIRYNFRYRIQCINRNKSKVEFLVKIKLEITKFNHVSGACKLHEKIQNILYFYEKINQPTINNIIKKKYFLLVTEFYKNPTFTHQPASLSIYWILPTLVIKSSKLLFEHLATAFTNHKRLLYG